MAGINNNLIPPVKGEIRNPKGKPKGTKHLTTWIQNLLEDDEFEDEIEQGEKIVQFKGAPIKAIVIAARYKAIHGDIKAMDLLMKYGWNPKQEIDLTSNGETVAQPIDTNLLNQFLQNMNDNTKR